MNFDQWVHVGEVVFIGLPVWYGAARLFFIIREYPPHLHDEDDKLRIKYPRGYEPTYFKK